MRESRASPWGRWQNTIAIPGTGSQIPERRERRQSLVLFRLLERPICSCSAIEVDVSFCPSERPTVLSRPAGQYMEPTSPLPYVPRQALATPNAAGASVKAERTIDRGDRRGPSIYSDPRKFHEPYSVGRRTIRLNASERIVVLGPTAATRVTSSPACTSWS